MKSWTPTSVWLLTNSSQTTPTKLNLGSLKLIQVSNTIKINKPMDCILIMRFHFVVFVVLFLIPQMNAERYAYMWWYFLTLTRKLYVVTEVLSRSSLATKVLHQGKGHGSFTIGMESSTLRADWSRWKSGGMCATRHSKYLVTWCSRRISVVRFYKACGPIVVTPNFTTNFDSGICLK